MRFLLLFQPAVFLNMRADCLEALFGNIVLDFAGVLIGRLFLHSQRDEKPGKGCMPLQHLFRNLHPFVRQGQQPFRIHFNIAILPQVLHSNAHTGLAHTQFPGDIDRPGIAL